MEKFRGPAKLVQWDPAANKRLCKFSDRGIFETEDKEKINKLKALGYKPEGQEKEKKHGRNK